MPKKPQAVTRTTVATLQTSRPDKQICIEVRYDQGGPNYFSGGTITRGYYLAVSAETINPWGKSLVMGEGFQQLIEPAKRFSAKALESFAIQARQKKEWDPLLKKTLAKIEAQIHPGS